MRLSLIVAVIAVTLIGTVYGQEPEIVEDILPEVKRIGHTGRLNCTVANLADHILVWEQMTNAEFNHVVSQGTKVVVYNPPVVTTETGQSSLKYEVVRVVHPNSRLTYRLIVRALKEDDGGQYRCYVRMNGIASSQWPTRVGNMTVQVPPKISASQTTNTIQKSLGSSAVLTCNATGVPTPNITWIRQDGRPLPLPGGPLRLKAHNLTITNIKKADHGTYRCVADNNVNPPDTHDAQLLVYGAPAAKPVQNSVGQAQNRQFDATLECLISGLPEPNLRWYKRTREGEISLSDDQKYDINQLLTPASGTLSSDTIWYSLKIINVLAGDYTEYYCEGSNEYGRQRATVVLYETAECQGADCPPIVAVSERPTDPTNVTMATTTRPIDQPDININIYPNVGLRPSPHIFSLYFLLVFLFTMYFW